jgi:hypothetical protein
MPFTAPNLELVATGRVAFARLQADARNVAQRVLDRVDVLLLQQIAGQHADDAGRVLEVARVLQAVQLLTAEVDDLNFLERPGGGRVGLRLDRAAQRQQNGKSYDRAWKELAH